MSNSIKELVGKLVAETLANGPVTMLSEAEMNEQADELFESDINGEYSEEIEAILALKESMDFWARECVEYSALMLTESGDVEDLSEATVRRHFKVGAATGAALGAAAFGSAGGGLGGFLGGVGGATVGGALGMTSGLLFAKGGLRSIQDKISRAEKKIQKWNASKNPSDKDKAKRMQEKIVTWKKELQDLKNDNSKTGKEDKTVGLFRSKYKEKS